MQIVSEQKGNRLEKHSKEGINIVIQFFLSKNQPGSVGKWAVDQQIDKTIPTNNTYTR